MNKVKLLKMLRDNAQTEKRPLSLVRNDAATWRELVRTSVRRMSVSCASALTAGYLTPLALLMANVPDAYLLGMAFFLGVSAQGALINIRNRLLPLVSTGAKP